MTSPRGISSDSVSVSSSTSVISNVPDRHGFFGGAQYCPQPKGPLSPAQALRRERKWLHMIDNWEIFMSQNYKKVSLQKDQKIILFLYSNVYLLHSDYDLLLNFVIYYIVYFL